jgi:hypothetical protein
VKFFCEKWVVEQGLINKLLEEKIQMTYKRSLLAGWTDYTGVNLEDIIVHLKEWLANIDDSINSLREYKLEAQQSADILENPDEVISYIEYFIDLFSRYRNDFVRLTNEIPNAVTTTHIDILEQIYKSSKMEENCSIEFKRDWVHKSLPHEETRPLLDKVYSNTRSMLIDFRDISNVVPRLKTFITIPTASQSVSPPEALPVLDLKPNIFGLGINLNRVFAYIRDWWRKK